MNFTEWRLCRHSQLAISQLPPHIEYQSSEITSRLPFQEREILSIIERFPHCGRNRIAVLLSESGLSLTPYQLKTILNTLREKSYIRILKTKQGCEITELGEYMLARADKR